MGLIKVGVLRGGPSPEHDISLKTGESVLSNLPKKYSGRDILMTKEGDWYLEHQPSDLEKVFRSVDVIFNALHGEYGEDGKVQRLLESFNLPYTGSGVSASALGMNKVLSGAAFKEAGLNVPKAIAVDANSDISETVESIFKTMCPPWVVKPVSGGSSVGVHVVKTLPYLAVALDDAFKLSQKVLVEEYIAGREATCGVIDSFREEEHYALPTVEIIPPPKSDFFDYDAKYSGQTQEVCPSSFDAVVKKEIEEAAKKAHSALGCRHYSRSDFIITPPKKKGDAPKIYILETNTLPGLTEESLMPKALNAVGSSHSEFLDHLIKLALKK